MADRYLDEHGLNTLWGDIEKYHNVTHKHETDGAIDGALLELTAKSKPATQQTTTGKNLARNNESQQITINGVTFTKQPDGGIHVSGSSTSAFSFYNMQPLTDTFQPRTYTASISGLDGKVVAQVFYRLTSDGDNVYALSERTDGAKSFNIPSDAISVGWRIYTTSGVSVDTTVYFQLELGSTATAYEPYTGGAPSPSPDYPQPIVTVTGNEVTGKEGRYVSLERRDSQGTLLDTTPIPLPSRGWVAGLPDGTADELTVDGAGKVVWDCKTDETTTAATDDITGTVGVDVMSTTGQIADGATVLYKHSTTEDCGYIDLPDTQDCVLSIPELDALGVRYTIGDGTEIARQWYTRAMADLEETQDAIVDLAADVTALDGRVTVIERRLDVRGTVYGFHVDSGESDSTACVTYLADALGMTPAHMDYANQRFDYGSWEDAFFMPKPCMLKYDGTVDYYLDPNDYSKKLDSTASDVADPTYAGNAMMEWGRDGKIIWYKVVLDADPTSYSVYIADNQVDDAYVCYPFVNGDGDIVKHFYTPCYFGSIVNDGTKDVLRSLSGQLGSARCKSKTAAQERMMAKANNPADVDIWDTEVYTDVILVNFLLTLISKSIESQTAFGQGLHTSGTDAINDGFTSGVHDAKGLFWGTNSGAAATYSNAVKVFGMENWWGFMWRRFAGLVAVNGTEKYKLTRGTRDGSTANDYVVSTTGSAYDGYLTGGILPSASGSYIKKQELRPDGSYTPTVVGGSASTYYRDALWTNVNAVTYVYRGGGSGNDAYVGAWCLNVHVAASNTGWSVGAAPSCKPQSPEAAMASRIKKLEQAVAELVAGA